MYIQRVLPWKSAKWEAPPAEEMSRIRKEAGTHDEAHLEEGQVPENERDTLSGETERAALPVEPEKENL